MGDRWPASGRWFFNMPLNLHLDVFFTLTCDFLSLNLHFCVFFTLCGDVLSPKFAFLFLFYTS